MEREGGAEAREGRETGDDGRAAAAAPAPARGAGGGEPALSPPELLLLLLPLRSLLRTAGAEGEEVEEKGEAEGFAAEARVCFVETAAVAAATAPPPPLQ